MLLRISVGYHFFKEGTDKLKSGTFTSQYFLAGAKGPFAPMFTGMLEDPDGSQQLCVEFDEKQQEFQTNPQLTIDLWNDFLDRAVYYYGFGSDELQQELRDQRTLLAEKIQDARNANDSSVDTDALEEKRSDLEKQILAVRSQLKDGEKILDSHIARLKDWLAVNEVELISYYESADRLDGFERDGENRDQAALYVDSIRGQVDSIRTDRQKKLAGWKSEIVAMWDSYEKMINELAIEPQRAGDALAIHRPFDEPYSFYKIVDKVIPWFDTIIGVSLILGLLTRFTSLAAAAFLVSVILSQPPWIPGTQPTYFYFIELTALLVIFSTYAGRFGGLDYFLNPALYRPEASELSPATEASNSRNHTRPERQPA